MKKTILLFLVCVMILSACNSGNDSSQASENQSSEPITSVDELSAVSAPEPESEPEPILTYFTAQPIEISEQGRKLAEEFLIGYPSLFSFGYRAQDGSFQSFPALDEELLLDPPLVWFGFYDDDNNEIWSNRYFFDREGNRIGQAVFIDEWGGIALRFELFELDGDGIPEIILRSGLPETDSSNIRLFQFVSGQYQQVEVGEPEGMMIVRFFFDHTGRLIVYLAGYAHGGYFYLDFTETGAELTEIIRFQDQELEEEDIETFFDDYQTMFGTGLPLTRIHPLPELHDDITQAINARLVEEAKAAPDYQGFTQEQWNELQRQKEEYGALSEKERGHATFNGEIDCPGFAHLEWEHYIDLYLIDPVGADEFESWLKEIGNTFDHCNIYSFAEYFSISLDELVSLIEKNNLTHIYDLETVKRRYEYVSAS